MRKVDLAELFCQGLGLDTTSDGTQVRRGLQIGYSDETTRMQVVLPMSRQFTVSQIRVFHGALECADSLILSIPNSCLLSTTILVHLK